MYQTFSLTLRDDGDPKQIVQNVSAWLSHKKFNTTNGLNGRVVTGTQVSLEFLQINRSTQPPCDSAHSVMLLVIESKVWCD